jgi:hypothetical protein
MMDLQETGCEGVDWIHVVQGRDQWRDIVNRVAKLRVALEAANFMTTSQSPIQWVSAALSLWVKRPGREADHSPPSSAEVKNEWSYASTPIRLHGLVLS